MLHETESEHPREHGLLTPIALSVGVAAAAATALWAHTSARSAEQENPPAGKLIEVAGSRLHYVEAGNGPPVVLLHGNTVLLQDFVASGLMDELSSRYRVVAFDRPGFGHSSRPRDRDWTAQAQAEILRDAIVALGLERPVIVGHSWGALPALALALDSAAEIAGLVLLSGYYYPTTRLDAPFASLAAVPVLGDLIRYTAAPIFARLILRHTVEVMFSPRPVADDFFEITRREMLLRPSQMRAVAEDAAFMLPGVREMEGRYGELSLPVAILAGSGDKVVDPQAHAVRLHRELRHSTLDILDGVGHMVHYAAPGRVTAAVEQVAGVSDERALSSEVAEAL